MILPTPITICLLVLAVILANEDRPVAVGTIIVAILLEVVFVLMDNADADQVGPDE